MSLGMTLAALIAVALHLESPFWPAAIVFILVATHFEGSIERSLRRIAATFSGAIIGLIITSVSAGDKGLYVALLFSLTAVSLYFYLTATHAYAYLVQGITAYLVVLLAVFEPQKVWSSAYFRCLEMFLGIGIALIMNKLFIRLRPANLLLDCMDKIAAEQKRLYLGRGNENKLKLLLMKAQEYLLAVTESTVEPPYSPRVAQLLIDRQWDLYREIGNSPAGDLAECIGQTNILRDGEMPQIPRDGELCFVLRELFHLRRDIPEYPKGRRTFNRDAAKQAIRLGLSAVLTLILWLISGWAGALFGVVTALMAGVERNIYSTVTRAGQRAVGACLGAGLGILMLMFCIHDVFSWTIVMLVGFWFFGWLALGPPNVQFIGLQGGFAFLLATVTSDSMLTNVEIPTQRLAGMLMGLFSTVVLAYLLWPVKVEKKLQEGLRANFGRARELIELRRAGGNFEPLYPLLDQQHRANLQLAACTRDEFLQNRLRLQTEMVLHIEAIGQEMNMAEVASQVGIPHITDQVIEMMDRLSRDEIPDISALQSSAAQIEERLRTDSGLTPQMTAFLFYVRQLLLTLRMFTATSSEIERQPAPYSSSPQSRLE